MASSISIDSVVCHTRSGSRRRGAAVATEGCAVRRKVAVEMRCHRKMLATPLRRTAGVETRTRVRLQSRREVYLRSGGAQARHWARIKNNETTGDSCFLTPEHRLTEAPGQRRFGHYT
jgi:hypothetical protein